MRLYKREDVWWCSYYQGGRRIRRSTRCTDRKAAEVVGRGWERDAADPHSAATRQTTLTQALERFVRERAEQALAERKSAATVRFYRQKAGHLIRVFEVNERGERVPFILKQLEARHVDAYISQRRKERASENTIYNWRDGMDRLDEPSPQIQCPRPESNQRHADFQSAALPTELPGRVTGERMPRALARRQG
jgi:hypothetical protein